MRVLSSRTWITQFDVVSLSTSQIIPAIATTTMQSQLQEMTTARAPSSFVVAIAKGLASVTHREVLPGHSQILRPREPRRGMRIQCRI